jgi:KH domain
MATQGSFGGGGGGFGGFPYRSSHQQGTDGQRGNNTSNRKRRRKRSSVFSCEAEIYIPIDRRGRIIGRGGLIIKKLRDAANTTIHVPPARDNNPNHPIRIKGSGIENVLYTCWKASLLLLDNENESVPCTITERSTDPLVYSSVMRLNNNGSFLVEENGHLSAYCIELLNISEDDTETLIDNVCFVDTDIDATCEVLTIINNEKEQNENSYKTVAVVIYGSPLQKPESLYNALVPYKTDGKIAVATTT